MRVIIVDDHAIVKKGLEMLLNLERDIEVVGTASNGQEGYKLVEELQPDVVMLDISMPQGESGLVTAGKLHTDFPDVKILMITMYDEKEYLLYTLQAGVSGYVLKNAPEEELIEAVRTVYQGGKYISKEMLPYLVDGFVNRHQETDTDITVLSDREIEVLTLIAKGFGNKEIGEKLFISVKTVESCKNRIMSKLDLKTKPELVEYAFKKKLLRY